MSDVKKEETKDKDASKTKSELGLLDEDDEFEEFPVEEWGTEEDDTEDLNVWEDNWDDDQAEDDFSQQLKAELSKDPSKMES
ncbi:unnamed protein product [Notodromas monacha]|uniref:26S proteasome complex subunit SEM1 n=1 Tax=Notodromas monacha TaxID=399045 RepID=A0A7R9C111_9CRUS|nr:unnamed protein product [Notodromas monacha]CAG0924511.1 unnamed protein product [Notodromas monacha]